MHHFDFIAPLYDRLAGTPDRARFQRMLNLPCTGRLLDAGGGTARISSILNDMIGQVVVNDLSYHMLKQASKKAVLPVRSPVERRRHGDDEESATTEILRVGAEVDSRRLERLGFHPLATTRSVVSEAA